MAPRPSPRQVFPRFYYSFLLLSLLFWLGNAELIFDKPVALEKFLIAAKDNGIINDEQYGQLSAMMNEYQTSSEHSTLESTLDKTILSSDSSDPSVFEKMYNKLTLLNVLYFSGALLIMGAYSLFMTLAFEHFTQRRWADIIALQAAAFGAVGLLIWNTEYQFLGGLLLSISTSIIPYTVYCYQRSLNLFGDTDPGSFVDFRIYVRSQWVYMELAAIAVGASYLYLAPFPFLLAPISFALWFLSMDVAPLYAGFTADTAFDVRRNLSIVFGLGMMILGRIMEWTLGSEPDFGFWLYLFGMIAFWFAIISKPSNDIMANTVFLLINISLVLIGSHLDRVTFHLFGTAGVVLTVSSYFNKGRIDTTFFLWILKALAVVSLLGNALRTNGSIEILNAVVCFALFNIEALVFIHKGEIYNWFILLTNLGFVAALPAFNYPLNLYFFEVPMTGTIMSVCSISVCLYHIRIFHYWPKRFDLKYRQILFLTYRLTVNVLVTLVMIFLQQHWWSWVGVLGIPIIAMLTQPYSYGDRHGVTMATMLSQFVVLLISIIIAVFIESSFFYLISCVCMLFTVIVFTGWEDYRSRIACCLAVCLIVLSVPIQSKFMTTIGGIYVFFYLSHLAYTVFKKSLMFPLVLISLGLGLIGMGIVYQSYQDDLYKLSINLIPVDHLDKYQEYVFSIDWYTSYLRDITFTGIIHNPSLVWFMWSGPVVISMSKERIPLAGVVCSLIVGVVILVTTYVKSIQKYCPDLSSKVQISSFKMKLDKNVGSGIIVKISGTKPKDLVGPPYISLGLNGSEFWNTMNRKFGKVPVTIARSAFLPYQLTPSLIKFTGFSNGSTRFSATIELGNGKQNKPTISHDTILNNCRKVASGRTHCPLVCTLMYSNAFYLPNSTLCAYKTSVKDILQMLEIQDN